MAALPQSEVCLAVDLRDFRAWGAKRKPLMRLRVFDRAALRDRRIAVSAHLSLRLDRSRERLG